MSAWKPNKKKLTQKQGMITYDFEWYSVYN